MNRAKTREIWNPAIIPQVTFVTLGKSNLTWFQFTSVKIRDRYK